MWARDGYPAAVLLYVYRFGLKRKHRWGRNTKTKRPLHFLPEPVLHALKYQGCGWAGLDVDGQLPLRGTIVNRTYGTHKSLYCLRYRSGNGVRSIFTKTYSVLFIHYGPPQWLGGEVKPSQPTDSISIPRKKYILFAPEIQQPDAKPKNLARKLRFYCNCTTHHPGRKYKEALYINTKTNRSLYQWPERWPNSRARTSRRLTVREIKAL